MIPYLLAVAGGYLIGDSVKTEKFNLGGMVNYYEADIDSADVYITGIDSYFGTEKGAVDAKANLRVEYSLEPEVRKWGVKSIYIFIKSVTGTIYWDAYMDDLSEEDREKLLRRGGVVNKNMIEGNIEFSLTAYKDWTIDGSSLEFDKDGAFSMEGAEIDFTSKILEIQ